MANRFRIGRAASASLLLAALAVQGCATIATRDCPAVDWTELGRQDGAEGRPAARIAAHQSACAESGAPPDPVAYEAGRREGLALYCTPEGVYEATRRGRSYEGVCPAFSTEMRVAYDRGLAYRRTASRLRDLEWRRSGVIGPFGGVRRGRTLYFGGLDGLFYWSEIRRLERRLEALDGPYPKAP